MPIKSDRWIRKMAEEKEMIRPFEEGRARKGVISYGLSAYGYDIRLADEFLLFEERLPSLVDPKNLDPGAFVKHWGETCEIPAGSFVLGRTVEYFKIPRGVLTLCVGKSTYARCGIIVNVTPFEPEWEGYATLEISNNGPRPARLYANEGIAQVLFLESDEECEVSYKDKAGHYQAQKTITPPKVRG